MNQDILPLKGRNLGTEVVKPTSQPTVAVSGQLAKPARDSSQSMRSIASPSVHQKTMPNKHRKVRTLAQAETKPQTAQRLQPHHVHAHRPEAASTLMRSAVKKPLAQKTAGLKVRAAVDSAFVHTTVAAHPQLRVDAHRMERASNAQKSQAIHRFFGHQTPSHESQHPAVVAQVTPPAIQSTKTTPIHDADYAAHVPHIVPNQSKIRLFTRFSNQFVAVSVGVMAIVIIAGFFISQTMPQIDARLASIHAGFSVKLPSYTPPGFVFGGHVKADPGTVSIKYQSVTDNREYLVSEQSTNWDSQTLKQYIKSTGITQQSWPDKGHTVYLYGNHLAWVSGGVWYQITDRADLTSSQLIAIATSM